MAQSTLFNSSDPATVAQGMRGNFTPGEKMLLANAGVQNADPTIRGNLQSDYGSMQGADPAFHHPRPEWRHQQHGQRQETRGQEKPRLV